MPPSEHIHVPTAEEAGMLPKALFIFINAHTKGPPHPFTCLTSSPFCTLMGRRQMLVHSFFIPEYLHPKPQVKIFLSCNSLLCDEAQMLTPPTPYSSGLSCEQIQIVWQLIHSDIFHMFVFQPWISIDFHTFDPSQFLLCFFFHCCSILVCISACVLWVKISICALLAKLYSPNYLDFTSLWSLCSEHIGHFSSLTCPSHLLSFYT